MSLIVIFLAVLAFAFVFSCLAISVVLRAGERIWWPAIGFCVLMTAAFVVAWAAAFVSWGLEAR